jgi:hypothetical protein
MHDGSEENSAEREAEEILKAAADEIQAEQCPQGRECGVHFRVDESLVDAEDEYARFISYVGEYVVVTEDNHELEDPIFLVRLLTGQIRKDDLPDKWETSIYWVGDGSIFDLTFKPKGVRIGALRYCHTHDDFSEVEAVHAITTSALEAGLIDVSKSIALGED